MATQLNTWRTGLGTTGSATITGLVLLILVLVNILGSFFFGRLDLTADRQYSLTDVSKATLRNLVDPVTIKIFVSEGVPQMRFLRSFIEDLASEYRAYGRGNVKLEFVDPANSPTLKEEAAARGIRPAQLQVRTSEGVSVRDVYSSVVIYQGEKSETIAQILDTKLEYDLTAAIRKVTQQKEVRIALVGSGSGHNKDGDYGLLIGELSRLYHLSELDLSQQESAPAGYNILLVAGPSRDFSQKELFWLDQYLLSGGKLIVLLDAVIDEGKEQPGIVHSNIRELLASYGIKSKADLVIDPQHNFSRPLNVFISQPLPWVIKALPTGGHPIINRLPAFYLPFASTLEVEKQLPENVTSDILAQSSEASWVERDESIIKSGQLAFTPEKNRGPFPVAVILRGRIPSHFKTSPVRGVELAKEAAGDARLLVVSSAQFLANANLQAQAGNAQFFLNAIDWLTTDSALAGMKFREAVERKIGELGKGQQQVLRVINFLTVPLLVVILGLLSIWRRSKRKVTI